MNFLTPPSGVEIIFDPLSGREGIVSTPRQGGRAFLVQLSRTFSPIMLKENTFCTFQGFQANIRNGVRHFQTEGHDPTDCPLPRGRELWDFPKDLLEVPLPIPYMIKLRLTDLILKTGYQCLVLFDRTYSCALYVNMEIF